MSDINKTMISGRLVRDPELRYTPSGTAVMDISIASNRAWKSKSGETSEETTFVDVTIWATQAESLAPYLKTGQWIMVEGRLNLDTWETTEGQKRYKLSLVADRVHLPPRNTGPKTASGDAAEPVAVTAEAKGLTGDDDEEIPF